MIIALTCVIAVLIIAYVLGVREKDLPQPEPVSPFKHLDDRKAAIYENLRDLTFEYRLGKLSDEDYKTTKRDLQKELAGVLEDIDKLKVQLNGTQPIAASARAVAAAPAKDLPFQCEFCGARFPQELKFCGECGKAMKVTKS